MQVLRDNSEVLIRMDPGEEMVETLLQWARFNGCPSATITGLGAVRDVSLGYFDLNKRKYVEIPVPREVEIVSLDGSLATMEGDPHTHLHVVVSSSGGTCVAGHLFSAVISITAELHLTILSKHIKRKRDPETGVLLWDLTES
jgi:predicted DNA-binding protein with PD1-like motif